MIIGVESCWAIWMPAEALVAPGPRRHKADARPSGDLADGFRHHRRTTLMAADGNKNAAVAQCIQHRKEAFAGNAEHVLDAVDDELLDQRCGSGSAGDGLVHQ
jgi:hypothetical protein